MVIMPRLVSITKVSPMVVSGKCFLFAALDAADCVRNKTKTATINRVVMAKFPRALPVAMIQVVWSHIPRTKGTTMSQDADRQQAKMKEFMSLLPLTIE